MASLLRQIVAGPRARHPEAGLDLCYVTDNIIATSGPSQTYPQRAYRNPLDRLVAFLDSKHGPNWAIWEFRAEGTGYPDGLVYDRIRHYPWPDHHPPPFRLVPLIMASMRNWLNGNDFDADGKENKKNSEHVVVVHCKAGKGRSGTVACSYLIAECGWTPEQALARFTERRMRPKMGAGVSIPSQLRTIGYVERWARHGKRYVDRAVEIVEVHVWGLRNGVKLGVEGYADEGKRIQILHTFTKRERHVVEGDAPGGTGVLDMMYDMVGYNTTPVAEQQEVLDEARDPDSRGDESDTIKSPPERAGTPSSAKSKVAKGASTLIHKVSPSPSTPSKTQNTAADSKEDPKPASSSPSANSSTNSSSASLWGLDKDKSQSNNGSSSSPSSSSSEPGGRAVIFKPRTPVRVPNSDVNITLERRNRAPSSMGLTMVTAVAHVWFNAFFEGRGPEQGGVADNSGVFEIDWDKMDGIKGSSQKGTRAADRIAVVWRAVSAPSEKPPGEAEKEAEGEEGGAGAKQEAEAEGEVIEQPGPEDRVPQARPADWKGPGGGEEGVVDPDAERRLGLRAQSPDSAEVSRASSVRGEVAAEFEKKGKELDDAMEFRTVRSDVGPEDDDGGADAGAAAGTAGTAAAAGVETPVVEGDKGKGDATDEAGDDEKLEAYAEKLPKPEGSEGERRK
ncbi:hypothetical protein DL762_002627 [Monosporascus cannonballus]|uniref:phosphatidylinositol-3,4,5-trisphosphate 3-phosphatase n=1 Tax=Monosporascus cannonballus TaxID=155416 RepID=A0ABY0HCW2_9PEZI|nr:hypothetical protein DL762_002627 [Monosporascus cannonballus]